MSIWSKDGHISGLLYKLIQNYNYRVCGMALEYLCSLNI